jgi:hypothetical protein
MANMVCLSNTNVLSRFHVGKIFNFLSITGTNKTWILKQACDYALDIFLFEQYRINFFKISKVNSMRLLKRLFV